MISNLGFLAYFCYFGLDKCSKHLFYFNPNTKKLLNSYFGLIAPKTSRQSKQVLKLPANRILSKMHKAPWWLIWLTCDQSTEPDSVAGIALTGESPPSLEFGICQVNKNLTQGEEYKPSST